MPYVVKIHDIENKVGPGELLHIVEKTLVERGLLFTKINVSYIDEDNS